jgi:hypothetical protein
MTGLAFDAGGLIAVEREVRLANTLLNAAIEGRDSLVIPATALAQVMRRPASQVRLQKLLQYERTRVVPLDRADAVAVGVWLAKARSRDIVDAHVVLCARRLKMAVLTSDAGDLSALAPEIPLIEV